MNWAALRSLARSALAKPRKAWDNQSVAATSIRVQKTARILSATNFTPDDATCSADAGLCCSPPPIGGAAQESWLPQPLRAPQYPACSAAASVSSNGPTTTV